MPSPTARGSWCGAGTTCTSTSRPDVPARIVDDVTLAHRFAELGLAGFGLKSHYTSTAERAQIVSGRRRRACGRSGRSR